MVIHGWNCRSLYFVISSNSNAFFDWRKACHVSWVKITNSQRKQQLELSTRTWSGRALWNRSKFVSFSWRQANEFEVFSIFFVRLRLREYSGSRGNKTHCFPWNQSLSSYSRLYMWSLFFSLMHMQSEDSRQTRLVFNAFNSKAPLK